MKPTDILFTKPLEFLQDALRGDSSDIDKDSIRMFLKAFKSIQMDTKYKPVLNKYLPDPLKEILSEVYEGLTGNPLDPEGVTYTVGRTNFGEGAAYLYGPRFFKEGLLWGEELIPLTYDPECLVVLSRGKNTTYGYALNGFYYPVAFTTGIKPHSLIELRKLGISLLANRPSVQAKELSSLDEGSYSIVGYDIPTRLKGGIVLTLSDGLSYVTFDSYIKTQFIDLPEVTPESPLSLMVYDKALDGSCQYEISGDSSEISTMDILGF